MKNISFALLIVLGSSVSALAGTSTVFEKVENGLFDDSSLAGFSTWTMRVEADTDWTNADLRINLTTGTLNHVAPAFLGSPNGTNGFGDTAGLAPTVDDKSIAGGFNGTIGFAGDHTESPTSFESSWFTTETDDIGTFDIAMITLSSDAEGTISWRTIAGPDVEEGGFTVGASDTWFIAGGRIAVPEPTSLALAGLALVGICTVSRRRS